MGAVAIALGVGAVASAGISAYSANQAGSAAEGAAATAGGQFKAAANQASGRLAKYEELLSDPGAVLRGTMSTNWENSPMAQAFTRNVNTFNQSELDRMLATALPGYRGTINRAMKNTKAWVKGQVPDDVAAFVEDRAAEKSNRYGVEAGSVLQRGLTARDLGRTSLDLMQMGENSMQRWLSTARTTLMPALHDPMEFLMTPQTYTNTALAGANIAAQRGQIEMGGQNMATNAYLQGQQTKIEADQAMYAAIAQGVESAAGGYAGYQANLQTPGGTQPRRQPYMM